MRDRATEQDLANLEQWARECLNAGEGWLWGDEAPEGGFASIEHVIERHGDVVRGAVREDGTVPDHALHLWCVHAEVGGESLRIATTGNGPTSQAHARFLAIAPRAVLGLIEEVRAHRATLAGSQAVTSDEQSDPRELTADEAFEVRRVAVTIGWKLGERGLSAGLHSIADEHDAPYPCEVCGARAYCSDAEGVALCQAHYDALAEEAQRRFEALKRLHEIIGAMAFDRGASYDAWKAVDDAIGNDAIDSDTLPTFLAEIEKKRDTWTPELEAAVREARMSLGMFAEESA